MLHCFIFAAFSKGPPATNGKARGKRGGERELFRLPLSGPLLAGTPARCRFFLGHQRKIFPLNPGKMKGEVFTLGLSDARASELTPSFSANISRRSQRVVRESAGPLTGLRAVLPGQVRSYFGTWAASRAKTIFAILIASCSSKRWVQVAAFHLLIFVSPSFSVVPSGQRLVVRDVAQSLTGRLGLKPRFALTWQRPHG